MRLVCPNCVAQYEVADGTIPDSGRDVQCANCGHIWFQDAAFKLSTDDLTYVPHRQHRPTDEDDDEDSPGVFHSQRAARPSDTPAEATERTLPEVADNVLDILRSEAAFSSRRRTGARAEPPAPQPEPATEPEPDPDRADAAEDAGAFFRRIGTRSGDIPPPETQAEPAAETAQRATDDPAQPAEAAFRTSAWRHMSQGRQQDAAPAEPDLEANDTAEGPGAGDTFPQDSASGEDAEAPALQGRTDAFFQDHPEPAHGLTGLPADETKRIADTALARGASVDEQADDEQAGDEQDSAVSTEEEAGEQAEEFRQAIRRISVRSLAEAPISAESADTPRTQPPAAPAGDEDIFEDEAPTEEAAAAPDPGDILTEDITEDSEAEAFPEPAPTAEAEPDADVGEQIPDSEPEPQPEPGPQSEPEPELEPETGLQPDSEPEPPLAPIDDPDDIRQVRRSLVENRKVLLPDVDELNSSLRMDNEKEDVDLRASAFSEDMAADRNKFWLGLVTALMLFGIFFALYLMGPAISDSFPAADPYVAAFREFVDTARDATAAAWMPVVEWLEAL